MKIPGKQSVLKYFEPVEMDNLISESLFDSEQDLDNSFGQSALGKKSNALLFNRFSPDDFLQMMKKVGLVEHLTSLGFKNLQLEIHRDDAQINYLKVYNQFIDPGQLLIDLRVSESKFVPDQRFFEEGTAAVILDMVIIEWLSAQHPSQSFDPDKPQLPGQTNPGLGCLGHMTDLMYLVGTKLLIDGFIDVPDHFHGAVMYSRKLKFFNPAHEAILRAILRDLKQYSLYDLSWAMITKTIIDRSTGQPQLYDPSEQIFPVSKYMTSYFSTKKYQHKFNRVYQSKKYDLDYDTMVKRRKELLLQKSIEEW